MARGTLSAALGMRIKGALGDVDTHGFGWVGLTVHDGTMALAGPGRQTDESASAMAGQLGGARGRLDHLPLIGVEVATRSTRPPTPPPDSRPPERDSVRAVEKLAFVLGLSSR